VCPACVVSLQAAKQQAKQQAQAHKAEVAALHLDRETQLKAAADELRAREEQLMCVPLPSFSFPCVCCMCVLCLWAATCERMHTNRAQGTGEPSPARCGAKIILI
jgi:hypothetical protein